MDVEKTLQEPSTLVDLPRLSLLQEQANWLKPARTRLLRRIAIARRKSILDLGCGYGVVTPELVRRGDGRVIGLDRNIMALSQVGSFFSGASRVCADALQIPFGSSSFDLVFCQVSMMWIPLRKVVHEIWRVLDNKGVLVALEPDYGGIIEYPPEIETKDLWIAGLKRAGADPFVGRKIPGVLSDYGFSVRVDLFPELSTPAFERFSLLRGLQLTKVEKDQLEIIEKKACSTNMKWDQVVHLPFMLITAIKQP